MDPGGSELPLGAVVGFYGVLAGIALGWRAWIDVPPLGAPRLLDVAAGLAVGLALVFVSRVWTARSPAGERLARLLSEAIGRPGPFAVAVMALASGFAEELLFRGALQPAAGWLWASLLFGAAHFVPRPGLMVWSLFAVVAGGIFGGLALWTGTIWAAVVAHITVNAINLHWLAQRDAGA